EMSSSVSPCATRTFCSIPTRPGSSPAPGTRLVAVVTFFGPAAIGVTDSCTVAQLEARRRMTANTHGRARVSAMDEGTTRSERPCPDRKAPKAARCEVTGEGVPALAHGREAVDCAERTSSQISRVFAYVTPWLSQPR